MKHWKETWKISNTINLGLLSKDACVTSYEGGTKEGLRNLLKKVLQWDALCLVHV